MLSCECESAKADVWAATCVPGRQPLAPLLSSPLCGNHLPLPLPWPTVGYCVPARAQCLLSSPTVRARRAAAPQTPWTTGWDMISPSSWR